MLRRTAIAVPGRAPGRQSLRAKGAWATVALLLYGLVCGVYLTQERAQLLGKMQAVQQLARHDKALALAEAAVNSAVLDVKHASSMAVPEAAALDEVGVYMESCARLFAELDEFDPGYAVIVRAVSRGYAELLTSPAQTQWRAFGDTLGRAVDELEIRHSTLAEQRDALSFAVQRQYDAISTQALLLALLGIAVFGSAVVWFFARLSGDIVRLESHARQIVHGSRGVRLPVARHDELGRLMHAVNRMAVDLDEREQRIALDSERRSYQEKMMAVGALAAGLAHEVNNPLTVISGVAQELASTAGAVSSRQLERAAHLILEQTQRAAQATRNLAEVAAPQVAERDWVDVNVMLRQLMKLLAYDKRYRQLGFESDLAADVPALHAPAAALQQVLMQLIAMGCDAAGAVAAGTSWMRARTRRADPWVEIGLEFPAGVDLASADVQRKLLLARAMIEALGVQLALDQDGLHLGGIKLLWPADPGST